jgi:poly-gamma-glutamate synthase PgsB/CapB
VLYLYIVFSLCCVGLLIAGIVEQRNHYRSLGRIPHRVLVNGIRGKSSITRLCAGALRGGNLVVVAKTTGTAARFVFPDASEEPVHRKFGIANVIEQVGIVRRAAVYHPDALVIECMAVNPALQEINQTKLIRSTIGVVSNVREDHLAEMGGTLDTVAKALCRSMPAGGVCVTAERERLEILRAEADRRNCRLVVVDPEEVTDRELAGFGWITFKENVAIALAVAAELGIDRHDALAGMWSAPPDPGVLSVARVLHGDKRIRFANVFAANDPKSTLMNIRAIQEQGQLDGPLVVVINCRPDRIERNGQMGELCGELDPEAIVLIGEPTRSARTTVPKQLRDRVVDLGGRLAPHRLVEGLLAASSDGASVVAVGNIHGQGEVLIHELAELPSWIPDADHHEAESMLRTPTVPPPRRPGRRSRPKVHLS